MSNTLILNLFLSIHLQNQLLPEPQVTGGLKTWKLPPSKCPDQSDLLTSIATSEVSQRTPDFSTHLLNGSEDASTFRVPLQKNKSEHTILHTNQLTRTLTQTES